MNDSPSTVMMRSGALPTWSAARTPPRMLSGTMSTNATMASSSDFPIAAEMNGSTGARNWYDVPMSPWTKPEIQSQYWVRSGRSTPS